MSQTIEAIYENGTFKPLGPVDLPEGTRVRLDVEPSTADSDEQIRQQLLSEGFPPEAIEKALATLHQLDRCFEGLTEEQLQALDEARLDQINFFNRPED
jgi:predicted DNA-binding antitoxin AbrB/MazE fold protein